MSSKAGKMSKSIKDYNRRLIIAKMEHTVLGNMFLVVGKLTGKSYDELITLFNKYKPNKEDASFQDVMARLLTEHKIPETYWPNIVAIFDSQKILTPAITLAENDNVWPVSQSGDLTGIMAHPERWELEYVFEESGSENP